MLIILMQFLLLSGAALSQGKPLLLKNATLHFGNGDNLQGASILIEYGALYIKGKESTIDEDKYKVLDLSGLHVYAFEPLSKTDSKPFVTEFENLISLHSTKDSTLTARVFHNQLSENYFQNKEAISNLVVLSREWEQIRGRTIRYVIYKGELMQGSF